MVEPAPLEGADQLGEHGGRGKDVVGAAILQQAPHHGKIDPVQQHDPGSAIMKRLGDEAGAMDERRHQQDAAGFPGHRIEMGALEHIGEPACLVRGDDRLGPSGGARGEADPPPRLARHRRQGGGVGLLAGDVLGGEDAACTGQIEAVAALGLRVARAERGFGRAGQAQRHADKDRLDPVGQATGDRRAGSDVGAQPRRKPSGALGEVAQGDAACAVMHRLDVAELRNGGGEVGAPGDGGRKYRHGRTCSTAVRFAILRIR